jgi:hypothetical protein
MSEQRKKKEEEKENNKTTITHDPIFRLNIE